MTRSLVLIVLGLSFTACKPATACTDVGIVNTGLELLTFTGENCTL